MTRRVRRPGPSACPGTRLVRVLVRTAGLEVAQVIRRYEARNELDAACAGLAIADLADLEVIHHEHEPLPPLVWQLPKNLTAYDAAYVAPASPLVGRHHHPDIVSSTRPGVPNGRRCGSDE
jgi:hypothetical protein